MPALAGIRLEFIFLGLTLLGMPMSHLNQLQVALTGLTVFVSYKLIFLLRFPSIELFPGSNDFL